MLDALELDRGLLPAVLESPAVVGRARADGVPVAAGAGDQAAGALGVGVGRPGAAVGRARHLGGRVRRAATQLRRRRRTAACTRSATRARAPGT